MRIAQKILIVSMFLFFISMEMNSITINSTTINLIAPQSAIVNPSPPYNLTSPIEPVQSNVKFVLTFEFQQYSNITDIIIEFDGKNYTQAQIANINSNQKWKIKELGEKEFYIHIQYDNSYWITYIQTLNVINRVLPVVTNTIPNSLIIINNSIPPLEVIATDSGIGISLVILEIDGLNYTMYNTEGDIYQTTEWVPTVNGTHDYKVYITDSEGNTDLIKSSSINILINVNDNTLPPTSTGSSTKTDISIPNHNSSNSNDGIVPNPILKSHSIIYIGVLFVVIIGLSLIATGKRAQIRPMSENGDISGFPMQKEVQGSILPPSDARIQINESNSYAFTKSDTLSSSINQSEINYDENLDAFTFFETISQYRKLAEMSRQKHNVMLANTFNLLAEKLENNFRKREVLISNFKQNFENPDNYQSSIRLAKEIIQLSDLLNDKDLIVEYTNYVSILENKSVNF